MDVNTTAVTVSTMSEVWDFLLYRFLHRASKVKNKGPKDIMAVEELNGEVRFSTHLPYPNNLSRFNPLPSLKIRFDNSCFLFIPVKTMLNVLTVNSLSRG